MVLIDWVIIIIYILAVVAMSFFVGRSQKDQNDYYLGGRKLSPAKVGASMAANQVSAISLVSAPAFIALKSNGGLRWLQYELAIPLAMIGILVFLVPVFRSTGGVTIYQYLEKRFGPVTRLILSFVFLMSRSLATGIALLATGYVTSVCIGLSLDKTIIIIGIISLLYTSMGGIKADIYSDILQLFILWGSSFAVIFILYSLLGGNIDFSSVDDSRLRIFIPESTGLGDNQNYSLLPMLFGGFFLYISYYGCDQSQAQRLLTTSDSRKAQKSLIINSLIRFPLVMTYCIVGLLLILFLQNNPEFAQTVSNGNPDMLMPHFFNTYVPSGLLGLIIAGIFAASMSSLDSYINSLSAATWDDFLIKLFPKLDGITDRKKVFWSRIITIIWGTFVIISAILFSGGSDTIIELVNKIGSAFYGPIAGVFVLGIVTRKTGQNGALTGLAAGLITNIILWLFFDSVSWLWWNFTGFIITVTTGFLVSLIIKDVKEEEKGGDTASFRNIITSIPKGYALTLVFWFLFIVAVCIGVDILL